MNCSKIAVNSDGSLKRTLFIPGPTWVDEGARRAMSGDMMGHRSPEFVSLLERSQDVLKRMMGTNRPVYLAGCSSWGMMEAALRNLVRKEGRVLNCCCGAFSDRWHDVARRCGYEADSLSVPWGQIITPEMLREALNKRSYDVVTIVHSETSTGALNPVEQLAQVVSDDGDTMLVVDVVSSYSAVKLKMDEWGIDVLLSGTQKALALPPGLTVCSVSQRALERAEGVTDRGFYFDFLEYERNALKGMTVTTPCIPLVMGLCHRTGEIELMGLQERCRAYQRCHDVVEQWAVKYGWSPLPPKGYRSPTLNCLLPPEGMDVSAFVLRLQKEQGIIIDGGYGQLKGRCVRISNMGIDHEEELLPLLESLSCCMR